MKVGERGALTCPSFVGSKSTVWVDRKSCMNAHTVAGRQVRRLCVCVLYARQACRGGQSGAVEACCFQSHAETHLSRFVPVRPHGQLGHMPRVAVREDRQPILVHARRESTGRGVRSGRRGRVSMGRQQRATPTWLASMILSIT